MKLVYGLVSRSSRVCLAGLHLAGLLFFMHTEPGLGVGG